MDSVFPGSRYSSSVRTAEPIGLLAQIRAGITRPGQLVRTADGLTTKVLNERLPKLVRFGVLGKVSYPEVPLRVEYHLTPLGARLNTVLDAIVALHAEIDRDPQLS